MINAIADIFQLAVIIGVLGYFSELFYDFLFEDENNNDIQ